MPHASVRLAQECLTAIRHRTLSPAPNDKTLLQQVVGKDADEKGFLYGGFTVSVGIRAALATIGKRINDFNNVLDYGCGSGRVLRWFQDVTPRTRLYGCDINPEAIRWCIDNIPFAEFTNNDPVPPLPFPDQTFDLIYGISVFTHLDDNFQRLWLQELRRIIKPGGILMLTAQGEDRAVKLLSSEEYDSFAKNGFLYKRAADVTSVEGLPDFYQIAFHSRSYLENVWANFFDIVGYQKHGCMYVQDLVIMSRPQDEAGRREREPVSVTADLPVAVIDEPVVGTSKIPGSNQS